MFRASEAPPFQTNLRVSRICVRLPDSATYSTRCVYLPCSTLNNKLRYLIFMFKHCDENHFPVNDVLVLVEGRVQMSRDT